MGFWFYKPKRMCINWNINNFPWNPSNKMYGFFFGKKIISPANSPNKRATHFWQCGLC